MDRRDFLRSTGIMAAGLALPDRVTQRRGSAPDWRVFEVTTRVEILNPSGRTRVWLPTPLTSETTYQRTLGNTFNAEGGSATLDDRAARGGGIIVAEWPADAKPVLVLTSRVATRDHAVDLTKPAASADRDRASLSEFLQATRLLPTDGIVKATAIDITRGHRTDLDKARAIYDWIVDNTFRNPKTRGCGVGDIRFMLESRDLGGKCADLNALFVGLARAASLPARDVYGVRLAKSERGLKSLGTATDNVTKAQHCRAEVYLTGYGWVPIDPADVRKVVLEEPPGNWPLTHELVQTTRGRLFGSWEMNWMAYNFAHDVALPHATASSDSTGRPLGFLMYPQAETANGFLDCLDPDGFKYEITSHQVA